jgi:hypothetical protein
MLCTFAAEFFFYRPVRNKDVEYDFKEQIFFRSECGKYATYLYILMIEGIKRVRTLKSYSD